MSFDFGKNFVITEKQNFREKGHMIIFYSSKYLFFSLLFGLMIDHFNSSTSDSVKF